MIIQASLQHAEVLSKIGTETFYNAHKGSAPAHELANYMDKIYSPDAIRKELTDPENIFHIIFHLNSVAGFSKMALDRKHTATDIANVSKMDQIYLLDSCRGLKLGAKLLSHNIDYSKSCGQRGMWLAVWTGNTYAITFYEKSGFQVVTRDEFRITDTHSNPCYIMFLKYDFN